MANRKLTMKVGERKRLEAVLYEVAGPFDLSQATSVTLLAKDMDTGTQVLSGVGQIDDAPGGKVGYTPSPTEADSIAPGAYAVEWHVSLGSEPLIWPDDGHDILIVTENLA